SGSMLTAAPQNCTTVASRRCCSTFGADSDLRKSLCCSSNTLSTRGAPHFAPPDRKNGKLFKTTSRRGQNSVSGGGEMVTVCAERRLCAIPEEASPGHSSHFSRRRFHERIGGDTGRR